MHSVQSRLSLNEVSSVTEEKRVLGSAPRAFREHDQSTNKLLRKLFSKKKTDSECSNRVRSAE